MKLFKRITSLFLACALIISMLSVTALADEEYYTSNSVSEEYARAATDWGVTPPTIIETIGTTEQRNLTLATSYWVEKGGYTSEPTKLNANFDSGEGLLDFTVFVGEGTIWSGTPCQVLTITPTAAAKDLTEATTVTGTLDIYWCGEVKMPFNITINPLKLAPVTDGEQDADGYDVVRNYSEDYANAATTQGAEPLVIKEKIGLNQRMHISLCTAYWVEGSSYSASPTELVPEFTSGEGLLNFDVFVGAGTIWDGADCAVLRVWATSKAADLTEATTVSGKFPIYWCGETEMEFNITIDPDIVSGTSADLPLFVDNTTPEDELEEGYDLRSDIKAILDSWEAGESATTIARSIYKNKIYGSMAVMSKDMIAKFPCALDGDGCEELKNFTAANARVLFNNNGNLVDIHFEDKDDMVMMIVNITEEGNKAQTPQRIEGELFFEEGLHMTSSIPFTFVLTQEEVVESSFDFTNIILIAEGVLVLGGAAAILLLILKKKKNKE